MEKSIDSTLSPTRLAFNAFRRALETGHTDDFLKNVTKDFHFYVPLPLEGWYGKQQGTKRFKDLIDFERSVFQMKLTPLIEIDNKDYGMVVFRAEGPLNGRTFSNELTIVFEFKRERICSFREYVGMPLKNYEAESSK